MVETASANQSSLFGTSLSKYGFGVYPYCERKPLFLIPISLIWR